jgi:sodium transport system ATP-binding protein
MVLTMIKTEDLTKVFRDRKRGEIRAVDRINIECGAGKVFGLLGPNGAGKTTALRLLATILKPTSGTASVNGCDLLAEPHRVRSQVGFLSGDTRLYDRLTPREILRYFGRLSGMTRDLLETRTDEIFRMLRMESFGDTRCGRLSGGMKQRVSIARTVIHDPPVLILDEPTAGLDIMARRTVVQFINRCKKGGKCTILSTHVMVEAETLCDEIAILHQGRIKGRGTLEVLLRKTGTDNLEDAFVALVGEETCS